jgi:hypothetical protein
MRVDSHVHGESLWVRFQSGIVHDLDQRMMLQSASDSDRIFGVPAHSIGKRLETTMDQRAVKGGGNGAFEPLNLPDFISEQTGFPWQPQFQPKRLRARRQIWWCHAPPNPLRFRAGAGRERSCSTRLKLFCILALLTSASFAEDEALKTRVVQARMSKLYADALPAFVPTTNGSTRKTEWSFTVHADGRPGPVTSSGDRARNFLRVQQSDTVVVHTHPFGTGPRPSECDTAIAVKLGIPNYELSRGAVWVAMPNGTSHKIAVVQWKHGQLILK